MQKRTVRRKVAARRPSKPTPKPKSTNGENASVLGEEQKPEFTIQTVAELGHVLPIGQIDKRGVLQKGFAFREEMSWQIDKAVARYKKQLKEAGQPGTKLVTKVLALMLTDLCGESFDHNESDSEEKAAQKILRVSSCYMADVWYMWLCLRIQEIGEDLVLPFRHLAPNCNFFGKSKYDLSTMKVVCTSDIGALARQANLIKGIKFRDGTIFKQLEVHPLNFFVMESPEAMEASEEESLLKLLFIEKGARAIVTNPKTKETSPVNLDSREIGSLRKIDIEVLHAETRKLDIGPSLISEVKCGGCEIELKQPIDWTYDSFFSLSSLF